MPRKDCNVNGNIRLAFSAHSKKLFFVVADGKYPIHDLAGTDHPYTIVADLAKGSKLQNFLVQSREEGAVICYTSPSARFNLRSCISQLLLRNKRPEAP